MEKAVPGSFKHLHSFVREVAGRKGVKVVRAIGDGATDEKIEGETGIKMSEVRHLLNQLHKHGIVDYTREKNMTTGWFTYTWSFNLDRTMKNFLAARREKRARLLGELSNETATQFYSCRKKCSRVSFDDATGFGFRCPKCNNKMNFVDNKEIIEGIRAELGTLDQILGRTQE